MGFDNSLSDLSCFLLLLNGATSLDSLPLDIWLLFLVALVKSAHSIKISQYIWWVIRVARIAPLTNPSDLVVGAPGDPQNGTVQGGETLMQRTCCSIASPSVPVFCSHVGFGSMRKDLNC